MKILTIVLSVIATIIGWYLLGTFIAGTFDSTLWDPFLKTIMSIIVVVSSCAVVVNLNDYLKKKKGTFLEEQNRNLLDNVSELKHQVNQLEFELAEERKPKAPNLR